MPNALRSASRTRLSITSRALKRTLTFGRRQLAILLLAAFLIALATPFIIPLVMPTVYADTGIGSVGLTKLKAVLVAAFFLGRPPPSFIPRIMPTVFADTGVGSVSLVALGTPASENFDTLSNTAGSTTNTALPTGWYITETGGGARDNEQYAVDNGGSTTGDIFSYGAAASTDRALGALRSGTLVPLFGAKFTNNTGGTINTLVVSYVGEEWRLGTAARTDQINFEICTNATDLSTGTYTPVHSLDFITPVTTTVGAKDGNVAPNRTAISNTITGLNIANGTSFFIRWTDTDASSSDDGLAVDSFSLTPVDTAPTVNSTTPANSATNVPVNSNVVINFSESVSATASAFSIQCPTGSPQTFAQSASPNSSFTLTPTSPLPYNTVCTVTVVANQITDTDANDPPDQMASDFVFSFTTANLVDTAPTVSSTTPANGATNVAVDSNIVINFSESVTATASAFSVQCPTGSPQSFAQSASPSSTFTLNPNSDLPYSTTCTVTVAASQISDTDTNDPPDQMASDYSFSFTTSNPPATNIIINEIDADTPSTDTAEFIELYDGGVGNTPLDGLVVVLFNGSNDLSYNAFDLDGRTTDANGYFVLGDSLVPGVDLVLSNGFIQNGQDAVALYAANAADFPNGSAVSTVNLRDAIVYDNGEADDPGLLVLLNAGEPQVDEGGPTHSIGRCPNGSGGARNTSTYLQGSPSPDGPSNCAAPTPTPTPTPSVGGDVVISQVYGGGGNTGADLKNDFIEIMNHGSSPISLNGWSVQSAALATSNWLVTPLPNFTLQPGQYFLIQESQGAGGTDDLPMPDAIGTITVSSTSGKIALVSNTTTLTGQCPTGSGIVDFIGYGSTDCFEGSGTAPVNSNTTAALRANEGCQDTNDNASDIFTGEPAPRNSSSPTHDCTSLFGVGSANPSSVLQGGSTTLTVHVSPAQNPTSTGVTVTADLSSIGGSPTQVFRRRGKCFHLQCHSVANCDAGH